MPSNSQTFKWPHLQNEKFPHSLLCVASNLAPLFHPLMAQVGKWLLILKLFDEKILDASAGTSSKQSLSSPKPNVSESESPKMLVEHLKIEEAQNHYGTFENLKYLWCL